eukprot:TRINITY_DN7440_c0_g1_i1.p1 TRINITY_DN7440_c0_g1~~TRINITY_DN7440_c0_g1_i1.p1  ORF type:complete len:218 (+),score=97.98 TRINITY_DN7440_c0_g1_i1:50-655(+)
MKRLKDKLKTEAEAGAAAGTSSGDASSSSSGSPVVSPASGVNDKMARIQVQRDLNSLITDVPGLKVDCGEDILNFTFSIKPNDGYWKGGTFHFSVVVPPDYPFKQPKCKCVTRVYHPNIDFDGNICLNILKDSWTCAKSLNDIFLGIYYLFVQPNPNDPLNNEVAELMNRSLDEFQRNVVLSLRGNDIRTASGVIRFKNVL